VQVATVTDRFHQMNLYVTGPAAPGYIRTAQRRPKTEVGMLSPKRVEIVTIVNGPLVPHTEKQRQLLGLRMAQIIRGHRAEGRNPRASSHEHGILGRIADDEKAQRVGHLHGITWLHRKKVR